MNTGDWIAVIISLVSLVFAVFTYVKTIVHDRKRDTLDAFNRLQNEAFDNLNRYAPARMREIAAGNKTSDEYKTVSGYIARIEHFCTGVNEKIYDKRTVYKLAHGYLDSKIITDRIDPFLKQKNRSKEYYQNIHLTLEWMQKQTKKSSKHMK